MRLQTLFKSGILGMNARNLLYIKPFNPKKAMAFADNKLKTKAYLMARGVPAAKIYARIEDRHQLRGFDFSQLPDECVLKPNSGFGGEGIIILKGRNRQGRFLKNGREPIPNKELEEHIEDILDGKFSIGGRRDTAFFEQILIPHECFAKFRPAGLPDIRIILFNLIPVMAMVRIPTRESDGKANMHLGGIGIGIDLAKGITTHAAQYHGLIDGLPHGGSPSGVEIPCWNEILLISSKIQLITNIGYLAVDITIDQNIGPALLEVNARAGLMVQLANLSPLRSRLERVKGLKVGSPEKAVRMCQDLFGEKPKQAGQPAEHHGKRAVLGTHETIEIAVSGEKITVPCLIAPGKDRTIFSPELIRKLVEKGAAQAKDKLGETYRVKFTLGGEKIQTIVAKKEVPFSDFQAIIGRRDLKLFLIDPSRPDTARMPESSVKADLRAMDSTLAQIDRDLLLIKYLKPINLPQERIRLNEDQYYNPVFIYPEIEVDLDEVRKRLDGSAPDDSPLGILLEKKRKELLGRIDLLASRGNPHTFTEASRKLFGSPSPILIRQAKALLDKRIACDLPDPPEERLNAEKAKKEFQETLDRYTLEDWKVSIRPRLVASCTVGDKNIYIREDARFERVHIAALIAHEIETHVLTSENGDHQPYALLRRGCSGYLDTQEGLAIYNQNGVLSPHSEQRFNSPKNLLGLEFGLEHSLAETRTYFMEELGYHPEKAITQAIAIKRGLRDTSEQGGFTKSTVYFRGLKAVEKFVKNGGDIKRLYVGKIALEDLDLVYALPDLKEPLLIPEFLRE